MLRLTVLSGARAGARVELAQPVIRIGRAPDNDLSFDPNVDLDASGHHAEIRADNSSQPGHTSWTLVDLGSRNGVFLPLEGMRRVQHHPLGAADQFQLGPQGPRVQVEILAPAQASAPGYPMYPATPPPQTQMTPQQSWAQPHGAPPPIPAMQPPGASPHSPGKMGQQTLLAHVGAMLNQQKRGKSTIEIKAMVEKETKKATGRLKTVIALLVVVVIASIGGIVLIALRSPEDPGELRKELEKLAMNDPKRKELEKKLAALKGQDGNVGRTIYEENRNALMMLVAHHGKSFDKGGFCTAFAIRPRILASNAHCVKAAEDFEDKGADIYVHLNESNKGGSDPKMFKIASHKGHPKYKHHGLNITPDVGLFVLEEDDAPALVKLAEKSVLKKVATGDSLFVIGFPGRTMDEASPVAVFMFSHVGRVTDSLGQRPESFEDSWLIQHEGQTTPGTSGSPIFNGEGKVIAINAGGLLEANKQSVYKYAMRIDLLEDIDVDDAPTKKKPKKKAKQKPDDDDE